MTDCPMMPASPPTPPSEQEADASAILIIDDDETFGQTLARACQRRGIKALAVQDGAQALACLASDPAIGRVVLDLNLDRPISGLSLIPRLLAAHPRLRIVLLTAYASIATATEAIRLGATHYLAKPASLDEVLEAFGKVGGACDMPIGQTVLSCPQLEWERLSWALVRHGGNISAAARFLGLQRRSLQRKLCKHARR